MRTQKTGANFSSGFLSHFQGGGVGEKRMGYVVMGQRKKKNAVGANYQILKFFGVF